LQPSTARLQLRIADKSDLSVYLQWSGSTAVLVSANLQVLQLQGRKLVAKGLFPPPPAVNSQFGRASCTAHSYRALAAERGEAFARFGWWISISLCSAESLHGTSPVRPTQEGLITKSLHGTREKLLMPPAQVIVTALADGD
jgi:hypothetical protein